MSAKISLVFLVLSCCLVLLVNAAAEKRISKRLHIPALGIGPRCTGCPSHFCDDDPAIIHGYCCGCARFFDDLPVKCSNYVRCPMNTYDICEDYEYMMHCCCSNN